MRILQVVALCCLLGGCYATGADVRSKLGQDYIGKNVDALVLRWGPPASTFRMNSGDTAYVWELANETSFSVSSDGAKSASGRSRGYACKVNVIASSNGTVTKLDTEDHDKDIYYGPFYTGITTGSMCAERLGIKRE